MFTNSSLFSYNEGKTSNNDVEIYYRDYGPIDAEPILLVQGLGGQLINWPQHLIEFLLEKREENKLLLHEQREVDINLKNVLKQDQIENQRLPNSNKVLDNNRVLTVIQEENNNNSGFQEQLNHLRQNHEKNLQPGVDTTHATVVPKKEIHIDTSRLSITDTTVSNKQLRPDISSSTSFVKV